MSRTDTRRHWTPDVRIGLLEQDADVSDVDRKELHEAIEKMASSSNKVLISTAGAAVMLAIDVLTRVLIR